jgi:hypothetical protein
MERLHGGQRLYDKVIPSISRNFFLAEKEEDLMKRIAFILVSILLFFLPTHAAAADDHVQICALTTAFECTSESGCNEVSLEDMALPRFVKIDLKAKRLESLDKKVNREPTKIATITRLEEMTILQGTEQRGWSIALGDNSGDLMLSVSGDGEGLVVFGSCVKP